MNRKLLTATILGSFLCVPLMGYAFGLGGNDAGKAIVGSVNGSDISKTDIDAVLTQLAEQQHAKQVPSFDTLKDDQKLALLKEVALKRLLANQVKESGIADEKDVKEKLATIENDLLQNEFVARKAKEAVTPEKVKARYDELAAALVGKEEFKVRHILVASEEEATTLSKQLTRKPASFEQLAKEKSKDSAANGGELGYIVQGTAPKEFEQAALALENGQISKPVKTSLGWHIIQLEDRRKATVIPFEQAKAKIEQQLAQAAAQDYFKKLLDGAKVQLASK